MPRNDGVDARKNRIYAVIQAIVAMLNNNKEHDSFDLDKTIANIEYESGLTEERVLEYASIGEKRGDYIIDFKERKIKRPEYSES